MEITPLKYIQSMYEQAQAEYAANRQARERAAYTQAQGLVDSPYRNTHPAYAGLASLWGPEKNFMSGAMAHRKEQMGIDNEAMNVIQKFLMEGQEDLSQREKSLAARLASKEASATAGGYPYQFIPMHGDVYVGNKASGDAALISRNRFGEFQKILNDQMALQKKFVDEGEIDYQTANNRAFKSAVELFNSVVDKTDQLGGVVDKSGGIEQSDIPASVPNEPTTAPVPVTEEDAELLRARLNGTKDPVVRKELEKNLIAVEKQLEKQRGVSTSALPTIPKVQTETLAPALPPSPKVQTDVSAPTTVDESMRLKTPEEKELLNQQYKGYAEQYAEDQRALASLKNMGPSIDVMNAILNDPKLKTAGQAHELLTKLGGWINYIDPQSSLAQSVNMTPAYFANMMNLVRDKIKSLGSGTAVSNLDLIVTQKSVGDLRNTPEGNKKLLAIMALQNATMEDRLIKKISFFENNKGHGYSGYQDYASSYGNEPTHMIRRNPENGSYYIQSKSEWIKEQVAQGWNPKEVSQYWKGRADDSVRRLFAGTGVSDVQFQGKVVS